MPESSNLVQLPRRLATKVTVQTAMSGREKGATFPNDTTKLVNTSIKDIRQGANQTEVMRTLYEIDGTMSTAVLAAVQTAMSGYSVIAFSASTRETDEVGQSVAEALISSWDTVWNYTKGYSDQLPVNQLLSQMMLEVALAGGVGAELVLDKARFPSKLVVFPYDTVVWKSNAESGRYPTQRRRGGGGGRSSADAEVNLDHPNIWVVESVKSAARIYSISYMVSAFKRLYMYEDFIEDMQRVVRRAGQPRLVIKLNYDKVVAAAPAETRSDPEKLRTFLDSTKASVESQVLNLAPEDSLVTYDLVDVGSVESKGEKSDYKELLEALAGLTASAAKASPAVLGLRLSSGSQNVASTESMLFIKMAKLLQEPVETLMSRALTLGVRMMGVDSYVKFRFRDIDLRPANELEAHRQIKQNRVMELLSTGRITDSEAQSMLGLGSLPEGSEELSGTFFLEPKAADSLPVSGTNAVNQDLQPDGPTSGGGKDNEKRV